jgi:hypothetical protein
MKKTALIGLSLLALTACSSATNSNAPENTGSEQGVSVDADFADNDAFLDWIQKTHFNYMWDGAESTSGLAPERIHLDNVYPQNDRTVVTTGGSGFGIAGIVTAIDRGFISRQDGVARLTKIVDYLAKADRYHGVWSHWIEGTTGKTVPFGQKDDGGDLVESSFLMEGLLCVREYFKNGNEAEQALAKKIDTLWREMEFDWYTRGGQDVLYWHWSPNYGWEMNFPLEGYNECMIAYILAASSPTHSISADAYHKGWSRSGDIKSTVTFMGLPLEVKHNGATTTGGPLFWAHYSWIGLDPTGLVDQYANWQNVTTNHAKSNYQYCVTNPKKYKGYSENCWGLTASYSPDGYSAHAPNNDLGVITPTASLSSFPYTPEESMRAAKYFYSKGTYLRGTYGFYDAFSEEGNGWVVPRYLAIDQLTIAPMIENYRSGLLWNLFMGAPEIQAGLKKLGFTSPHISNNE